MQVYDRYCQHQIRDITAVQSGMRPLRAREKDAIHSRAVVLKGAASSRTDTLNDEWHNGQRAPTSTKEHKLSDRRGGGAAHGRRSPQVTDEAELIAMRAIIIRGKYETTGHANSLKLSHVTRWFDSRHGCPSQE